MNELVAVNDVTFTYNGANVPALDGLDLSIAEGEWVAVVGHNGSGKSTLARMLNGLLLPDKGSVQVKGYDTSDPEALWEIRKHVGIVFQNPDNQMVATLVRDDIAFGLENLGVNREEMNERIDTSLKKVNMSAFIDHEPHRLSGGQKQRVAIAGILAMQPSLFVLDEATSMLDPIGRKEVIETMLDLNKNEQMSVVSITHDLNEAVLADRIIVLKQGKILLQGTPEEVFEHRETLVEVGLNLPFTVQLREELRLLGVQVSSTGLTQEELVDELWTLHSKM
ncbi:energy-coupling factor ABC transporter ATP-binding protein [Desertibacillus haloalkaliphilus]|uniref:energy-coupling factor ABC transporter ATP-binding protein n=1 Tax=Desertibacillus haloalkaliphilus TaxID=1328930 RepID=UPI001C273072|nr:energy-coupling factor ABC transporter ATP-binding protein [Desertibacillus haloalkaliphilus]MBU8908587.1 energy-coupling factor ABC transporter ATP-binding protein [Desertibacillus haloalkaliphilus]